MREPRASSSIGFLAASTLTCLLLLCEQAAGQVSALEDPCVGINDFVLMNAKILTVDTDNPISSAIRVQGERIVAVGDETGEGNSCTRIVDLEGRTVIPGLINSHLHFARQAIRPGYVFKGIVRAFNIPDLQEALSARTAQVPEGEWITTFGGWTPGQFEENRVPTADELTAAAPRHPVFLMTYPFGPTVTNQLGKAFFEASGITVGPAEVETRNPLTGATETVRLGPGELAQADKPAAHDLLVAEQTEEDRRRSVRELMHYSASLGLTNALDMGGLLPFAGLFDQLRGYDPILQVWKDGGATMRLRLVFQNNDRGDSPSDLQGRMDYAFPGFGDDMLRTIGIGEDVVNRQGGSHLLLTAYTMAAEHGWLVHQHSQLPDEQEIHTAAFEEINAEYPLADLHWSIAHMFGVDDETLERHKAMGLGVSVQSLFYLAAVPLAPGPPYRRIVDSGIIVGGGTDGQPMSPWTSMWHMTTGKTVRGNVVLPDDILAREEALEIYTKGSAWFTQDDRELGTLEVGKVADLVVLSGDFLETPDEQFRDIHSVLTVIGGNIVYSDNSVVPCSDSPTEGPWYRESSDERCAF